MREGTRWHCPAGCGVAGSRTRGVALFTMMIAMVAMVAACSASDSAPAVGSSAGAQDVGAAAGQQDASAFEGLSPPAGDAAAGPAPGDGPVPTFPFGAAVVLVPVQSVRPAADGSWMGEAASEAEALEAIDAELAFAFDARRGAANWALPEEVIARATRNPLAGVDPRRLAYAGLLVEPQEHAQIYEPLHGQLRMLAALFDTRYVVLPLVAWMRPTRDTARQAVMLIALIDIRRSQVLWHGEIRGPAVKGGGGGVLARLAQTVARTLSPS